MRLLELVRMVAWLIGMAAGVLLVILRIAVSTKQFGAFLEGDKESVDQAEDTLVFWTWVLIAVALAGLGLSYLIEGCAQTP